MINDYINDWLDIIEQMNTDNTYKLAWGRAVLECVNNDEYVIDNNYAIISFDNIAYCVLKYYWNQIFFFNLKQAPYKDKEPIICKYTKEMIEEYKKVAADNLPIWFNKASMVFHEDYLDIMIRKISKALSYDVCWRFKNTPNGTKNIYEYDKSQGNIIKIEYNHISELKEYFIVLSKLLNYKWTQLLEGFNFAPKIAKKVNGISNAKIKRNSLTKFKELLLKQFNDGKIIDFYTGEELDEKDISIDHVIPWSFMYSDDIWNLVITSKSHNSSKSNSIPTSDDIDKLKKRNMLLLEFLDGNLKEELLLAIDNDYVTKFYNECRL